MDTDHKFHTCGCEETESSRRFEEEQKFDQQAKEGLLYHSKYVFN
jgi:hypothetical protein